MKFRKSNSYDVGHSFEDAVYTELIHLFPDSIIVRNLVFKSKFNLEVDIILINDNRVLVLECKELNTTLELSKSNNMTGYGKIINNPVERLAYKVTKLNETFGCESRGIIITSNKTGIVELKSMLPFSQLYKLTKVVPKLNQSCLFSIKSLLEHK